MRLFPYLEEIIVSQRGLPAGPTWASVVTSLSHCACSTRGASLLIPL
jgi:hypothetical protein